MMRFYRLLLSLYPASFRSEYREELCRAFAEHTRGRSAPAVFVAAIVDVVPNAIVAHWDNLRHGASGAMALPTVGGDVRFALRQIARAPLFSGVVIAVIALGIGINAGLLTVLNTYAWRPAPGIESDGRLARLTPTAARGRENRWVDGSLSYPDILDLRERHDVFTDVAAWRWTSLPADFGSGAEAVDVSYTTANFFRVLRVAMAAGTGFPEGVEVSAPPIVVIGHSVWMTNFGGSPDAIGKTIRVMNQPFTIVGVAPPLFFGVDVIRMGQASIWIPLGARALLEAATKDDLARREAVFLKSVVRLAPGVDADDVDGLTAVLAARLAQQDPESHRRFAIRAERLHGMQQGRGDTKELVAAFLLAAGLIVVITCTNVSALLLGRAVARRREIGVRLSLGATRLRIVRQMLTESLILAIAGALLGLILYATTVKIGYATVPELIYGFEPQPATFLFAAMFALVTTIAFGLVPALHASKADIGEVIKNSGTHTIRRFRLQAMFVVIQLACSQPALVVTSLVLIDIRRAMNDNADQAPASVLTMRSELPRPEYSARGLPDSVVRTTRATFGRVRQRLAAIPGVQSVAIITAADIIDGQRESFADAGAGDAPAPIHQGLYVTPDYFTTLGLTLVRGRAIGVDEDYPGSLAVVVDEDVANSLWPGADAIGKRLVRRAGTASTTLEVIGVARRPAYEEVRQGGILPRVYVPLATTTSISGVDIAVRTSSDARPFVPAIRAAIREVEPLLTVDNVTTIAEQYASRKREAVQSNMAAFAVGAAALLLASLGLYAIIAFAVAQRTREIGVRLAIGATPGDVVRHFFRNGLMVTAIGLAIGLPVTVAGIRLVQANLLGFTVKNVAAVMLVVPVLIGIAALASWLPARRAGRVDPLIALRSE